MAQLIIIKINYYSLVVLSLRLSKNGFAVKNVWWKECSSAAECSWALRRSSATLDDLGSNKFPIESGDRLCEKLDGELSDFGGQQTNGPKSYKNCNYNMLHLQTSDAISLTYFLMLNLEKTVKVAHETDGETMVVLH